MASNATDINDIAAPAGWDTEPHQWRRYGARTIDTLLFGSLSTLVVTFVGGFVLALIGSDLVFFFVDPPMWSAFLIFAPLAIAGACVANALCEAAWGSTPGKWIFRLKVLSADGGRLTMGQAFAREFHLFWRGMGCGLPLLSLITLVISYNDLDNDGATRWDSAAGAQSTGQVITGAANAWLVIGFLLVIVGKVIDSWALVALQG